MGEGLSMRRVWRHLRSDDRGATAVEYGLMVAIVGIGLLMSARFLGDESIQMWNALASSVSTN